MTTRIMDEAVVSRRKQTWPERAVARVVARFDRRESDRRSFLSGAALMGSALAVAPRNFVLKPQSAYGTVCGPGSQCADGWTVFCCTVNGGSNSCPPGSIAAGWWKNDTTPFCGGGPRYVIDCNAICSGGCDSRGFCDSSHYSCRCRCHDDPSTCDHRRHCCNLFRYGQCHQELGCVGPVVCRIASCSPPWTTESTCTQTTAISNATNYHNAPCVQYSSGPPPQPVLQPSIHEFGDAGRFTEQPDAEHVAGMDVTPTGQGYWVLGPRGRVIEFGDATNFGSVRVSKIPLGVRDIAARPNGLGYWILGFDGRVFAFGDAPHLGGIRRDEFESPATSIAVTPTGEGYWLLTADGTVWPFGDAVSFGSLPHRTHPVDAMAIAGNRTGNGYWIADAAGHVFAFGGAHHFGQLRPRVPRRPPVVAMAASVRGDGYWLLRLDGKIHGFGNVEHYGELWHNGVREGPNRDLTRVKNGGGYWILTDH